MKDNDLATILLSMLKDLPQVSIVEKANHISFLVGKKVFAYTQSGGVVIKLPKEKVRELIEGGVALPLVMGQRVMKEWAILKHERPQEYQKEIQLFKDAIAFVAASGASKR